MRSHLGSGREPGSAHLGRSSGLDPREVGRTGRNIFSTEEVVQSNGGIDSRPHGKVVNASDVYRGEVDEVYLHGGPRDPRAQMRSEVYADASIRDWTGSSMQFFDQELPENDMWGQGMSGTGKTIMASELDQVDAQHGTHKDYAPLEAGAYQLTNGMVLIVMPDGRRGMVTPEQFQAIQQRRIAQQAQQQAPHQARGGLAGRIMGRLRG